MCMACEYNQGTGHVFGNTFSESDRRKYRFWRVKFLLKALPDKRGKTIESYQLLE